MGIEPTPKRTADKSSTTQATRLCHSLVRYTSVYMIPGCSSTILKKTSCVQSLICIKMFPVTLRKNDYMPYIIFPRILLFRIFLSVEHIWRQFSLQINIYIYDVGLHKKPREAQCRLNVMLYWIGAGNLQLAQHPYCVMYVYIYILQLIYLLPNQIESTTTLSLDCLKSFFFSSFPLLKKF